MKIEIDALSKEEGRVKANMGGTASKKCSKVLRSFTESREKKQEIREKLKNDRPGDDCTLRSM